MGRRAGLFLLLIVLFFNGMTQVEPGAACGGLGGACAAIPSGFAVAGNPSCMSWTGSFSAGFSAKNEFALQELINGLICASFKAGAGHIGVLVTSSGLSGYNESTASFSYSLKIWPKFSAAVRAGYYRLSIAEGYGTKNTVTSSVSFYFRSSEAFSAGLIINNPCPVRLSDYPGEYLQTSITTGVSWMITDKFITAADIYKDLERPIVLRAGAGYTFTKMLAVRMGFSTAPFIATFGTGIIISHVNIDISTSWHPALGYSPQISLSYNGR